MAPTHDGDPLRTTDRAPGASAADPLRTTDISPGDIPEATYTPGRPTPPARAPAAGPAPPVPSIPGYQIEGVLGRGGMGVVYRARHLALKRTVALKMVLSGGHAGPAELARFRTEAEAAARL